ncbi:MAG: hypothetical protein ACK4JD_13095 [Thermoflexales bacterium]
MRSAEDELRASEISLLVSLQAVRDIQRANVEIAESADLGEAELARHRAFLDALERAWRAAYDALQVSSDEYDQALQAADESIRTPDQEEFRFIER